MDYLWHKISESEKKAIKKEAKAILEKFSKALEKIEKEIKGTEGVKRNIQFRNETKPESNKEFRKLFFKNVPKSEDNYIIAEKGRWK
ncbi:MAG: Asp-tRNA(Asn) amidotransferase GatCAB subunit C [Candidatus Pacearchaeota archaeon]